MGQLQIMNEHEYEQVYQIMKEAFPKGERRIYKEQKQLLQRSDYFIDVVKNEKGTIIAFIAYWKISDFYFIEHFAVSNSQRGGGVGREILLEFQQRCNTFLILEVEPYGFSDFAERRIQFYKRLGFHLNDFEYYQMPLRKGYEKMPLKIMSWPQPIKKSEFEMVKTLLYKTVYYNWQIY